MRIYKDSKTLPIFTEKEIENIFYLFNLKGNKTITQEKCKEALKNIAHSQKYKLLVEEN